MSAILDVLLNNISPVFLVAGAGFLVRRLLEVDTKTVARITFYIFSPCLLFSSLVNSTVDPTVLGRIALVAATTILLTGMASLIIGRILRFSRDDMLIIVLAGMFGNVGNFGLPLNQLRYGDMGVDLAIPYMTTSALLIYSVGVVIASLGQMNVTSALKRLTKLPVIYAIVLAVPIYLFGITLPFPVKAAIDIAAEGAVPVMLLVLGMQMADVSDMADIRIAFAAALMRLIVSPLIVVPVIAMVGLSGLSRSVSILEASVPIAVATIVITTEFDVQPTKMTSAVVLSTFLSPLTLVAVIQLLGL